MERKLLDMMNQLSISEYNPRMEYCDKFQFLRMIQYLFNNMRYLTYDVKRNIDSYIKM